MVEIKLDLIKFVDFSYTIEKSQTLDVWGWDMDLSGDWSVQVNLCTFFSIFLVMPVFCCLLFSVCRFSLLLPLHDRKHVLKQHLKQVSFMFTSHAYEVEFTCSIFLGFAWEIFTLLFHVAVFSTKLWLPHEMKSQVSTNGKFHILSFWCRENDCQVTSQNTPLPEYSIGFMSSTHPVSSSWTRYYSFRLKHSHIGLLL